MADISISGASSLYSGTANSDSINMSQNYDSVTIDAGAGDDAVYIYYTNYSSINAGTGSDSLYLYDVRTSTLLGGAGNDTFQGNISSTTLFAGAGDDVVSLDVWYSSSVMGNEGNDVISLGGYATVGYNEGDGNDTIYGWNSDSTFNIMGNKTRDAQSIIGDDLIVTIGSGTVRFVGVGSTNVNIHQGYDITSNSESLQTGSVDDVVNLSTQYDSVTIDTGAGDDSVYVYYTNYSSINAGDGNDSMYLSDVRSSTLLGGDGNDTFTGGHIQASTLLAGAGDDVVSLDVWYSSSVMGNEGNDVISLNATSSTTQVTVGYNEGDGNDTIYGWNSDSTFNIMGNKTRDAQSIVGDDLIVTIGSGTVRFVGVGSTNVNIHQGYDITSNSESLQAGSENDVIQNMPSTTYFDSVTVDAGAGDDSINFRGRYYSINAGDGNDSIYFNDLRNSTVLGGNGNDSFYGTPMSNLIFGGAGDDLFSMNSGYAVTIGYADGDGNDSIVNWNSNSVFDITYGYLDSSVQSGSNLLLNIGSSQVTIANTSSVNLHQGLIAESAGTSLNGTDSSEFLTDRGYSSVTIDAGAGDDSISIGGSDTSVDGGSGNDLIVVRSSSAVIEFSDGADTLDGFGSGVSIHSEDATGSVVGNDYVILSGDNTLTLLDAGASMISGDGYFTYGIGSESGSSTGSGSDSTAGSESDSTAGSESDSTAGSDSGSTIDNGSSNLVDNESVGTVTVTGSTEYTGSELSNALGIEIASSGSDTYSVAELTSDSISLTLDESGNLVASSGSESTSDSIAQVSLAVDSVTGLLSMSVTGGSNATEDSTLTFKGGTSVSKVVADFSNSSGNFDVNILNVNVADLTFSSDSRISATFDSLNTGAQITLTGGAQDGLPDSGNTFYAVAGSGVSTKSDQAVITITDVSFNATDVLKVDAGIENLTADFFGNGKFYNYATVSDASTSGVYSSTVLDVSDLVENLEMSFSMLRMANGSSSLDDENAVDESNIVNVIWANSGSATIDFSQSQTSEVLIFTDTNGRSADIVSLGGDYNDTIHAGRNDTVDAGGGDDQIYLEGKNIHVIFGSSEGNDTIYGWNSTDYLEFDSIPDLSIVSGDLYLENENGTMLIDGSFTNSTNIRYSDGILRVGYSNGDVIYDKNVTYYAGSNLILDTSRSTSIDLSSSTYENISMIDASNGRGRDVFRYTSDAGNVTISNGDSRDIVDLSSYSIDEISTEFTDSGLIISIDDSSLNIIGTEMTQFSLASGRYTADFNNQTFNS